MSPLLWLMHSCLFTLLFHLAGPLGKALEAADVSLILVQKRHQAADMAIIADAYHFARQHGPHGVLLCVSDDTGSKGATASWELKTGSGRCNLALSHGIMVDWLLR